MLGFQRAVVFAHDQFLDFLHHVAVFLDIGLGLERLGDDEVVVAFEGVAVDAGILVTAFLEQPEQVACGLGQVVYIESDVLDEGGGACGACAADGGEDARAQGPPGGCLGRVGGEMGGFEERELVDDLHDAVDFFVEFRLGVGLGVQEQGGEALAGGVVDRGQRLAVEEFAGFDGSAFLEGHDAAAGLGNVAEIEH